MLAALYYWKYASSCFWIKKQAQELKFPSIWGYTVEAEFGSSVCWAAEPVAAGMHAAFVLSTPSWMELGIVLGEKSLEGVSGAWRAYAWLLCD